MNNEVGEHNGHDTAADYDVIHEGRSVVSVGEERLKTNQIRWLKRFLVISLFVFMKLIIATF